jgi:hypothetical protein
MRTGDTAPGTRYAHILQRPWQPETNDLELTHERSRLSGRSADGQVNQTRAQTAPTGRRS